MKAQMLATMAALKNSCSPSSATKNVLQISNINVPKADPPCESYLTNSAPYEQLNIKIEMTSKNGFPNLLPANGNHFYIFTDGSKSNEGTGYAAILTPCIMEQLWNIQEDVSQPSTASLKQKHTAQQQLLEQPKTNPLVRQFQSFPTPDPFCRHSCPDAKQSHSQPNCNRK